MTLLMWFHYDNGFEVITDTLATDLDRQELTQELKFHAYPDRRLLVAATGLANLADAWWDVLESGQPQGGIEELAALAPQLLTGLWEDLLRSASAPDDLTATIYHFGFTDAGDPVQRTYDSRQSFVGRVGPVGNFAVKPEPSTALTSAPDDDGDLIELALQVQREQSAVPNGKGVRIGGSLVRTFFGRDGHPMSEEFYRFDE